MLQVLVYLVRIKMHTDKTKAGKQCFIAQKAILTSDG